MTVKETHSIWQHFYNTRTTNSRASVYTGPRNIRTWDDITVKNFNLLFTVLLAFI